MASPPIMTKHNADCNMMALPSAYKLLASADLANQASSSTGYFLSCVKQFLPKYLLANGLVAQ